MDFIKKCLKTEIFRYLVVGGGAVGIDFISHMLMLHVLEVELSISKAIAYILGAIFSFIVNKIWTFKSDQSLSTSFVKFSALYATTFITNVAVNAFVVWIGMPVIFAFGVATATSIILNYLGQKFWVYRKVKTV